jgi:hypothetical protein
MLFTFITTGVILYNSCSVASVTCCPVVGHRYHPAMASHRGLHIRSFVNKVFVLVDVHSVLFRSLRWVSPPSVRHGFHQRQARSAVGRVILRSASGGRSPCTCIQRAGLYPARLVVDVERTHCARGVETHGCLGNGMGRDV